MDARVLDYIDDRLATSTDFDALDSLIENAKAQQDLLKKQVNQTRTLREICSGDTADTMPA